MLERKAYLKLISLRGDRYGNNGGLLDLLYWCGKTGLYAVTDEELAAYYEHPERDYEDFLKSIANPS